MPSPRSCAQSVPPRAHTLGPGLRLREISRAQLSRLWTIDRRERIEGLYSVRAGRLHLSEEVIDVPGWPPGESVPADEHHRAALAREPLDLHLILPIGQ